MNVTIMERDGTITKLSYSLSLREAIVAAYAQFIRRDFNTWDYARRYADIDIIERNDHLGHRMMIDTGERVVWAKAS